MIKVINFEKLKQERNLKIFQKSFDSEVGTCDNGMVKLFTGIELDYFVQHGHSLEERIEASAHLRSIDGLNLPREMIEKNGRIIGYTMSRVKGQDFETFCNSCRDLRVYADIFAKLEKIIIAGHKKRVVFPDLCNPGNVIITPKLEPVLIDFDSFQINNMPVKHYARVLEPLYHLENLGAVDLKTNIFSEKVDSISMLMSCMLRIFKVNISYDSSSLDNAFKRAGITGKGFQEKARSIMSKDGKESSIVSNLQGMADDYNLVQIPYSFSRRLERK